MKKCTKTDNAVICVLMAIYEPNLDWLDKQLKSIDMQTYRNVKLYIKDDCSKNISFEEIQSLVNKRISSFDVKLTRNEKNLGSNLTFERLTQEAEGHYFAYCDQDDIWLPEKLEILKNEIEDKNALLVCSDMFVIDGNDNETADSITKARRHHIFYSGDDCVEKLLVRNFVTGCTMMVKSDVAKQSIPFCPYMVHDHYIALYCAEKGIIYSVPKPLIKYRIHGGNQTGLFSGVVDRDSYFRLRIDKALNKFKWLKENQIFSDNTIKEIDKRICWMQMRALNWKTKKIKFKLLKYSKYSFMTTIFEIFIVHMSDNKFNWFIDKAKKNKF